jgi:POT family proton-dependent oligopeptide transporter
LAFERLFYPALVFLILGNGAFKPNISTQVGALYARDDARRDRAFSIFYVGINLGAFFSPLVCGTLGEVYGWHYGFGAAGVGMLIGLGVYLWGRRFLAPDWTAAAAACDKEPSRSSDSPRESTGRSGIGVLFLVCAVTTAFWAVYEQQGNTIALWADSQTDRMILGWEIPASWVQSLNPALVFIITPFLTWFWGKQAARGKEPSAPGKMAIGCFLAAAAFLVLAPAGAMHGETSGGAGLGWIFVFTLLLTVGELYLSPIGLSYVTKIAPARMVSMLMGVWLMSAFFGNIGSGFLGSFWEKMPKDTFFLLMAGIASVAGALLVCINRFRPKGSS